MEFCELQGCGDGLLRQRSRLNAAGNFPLFDGRGENAVVDGAVGPLMVLLDEEAPPQLATRGPLELELEPERVRQAAAEAEVVVFDPLAGADHLRRAGTRSALAYTPGWSGL